MDNKVYKMGFLGNERFILNDKSLKHKLFAKGLDYKTYSVEKEYYYDLIKLIKITYQKKIKKATIFFFMNDPVNNSYIRLSFSKDDFDVFEEMISDLRNIVPNNVEIEFIEK